MIAEHLAKRPVQDVGGGVVATNRGSARRVDRRGHPLADLERGQSVDVVGGHHVAHQPGRTVGRIADVDLVTAPGDEPGVADLAARFGVERGPVQHDGVADDAEHVRLALLDLAADKDGLAALAQLSEGRGLAVGGHLALLGRGLGAISLIGHRLVESVLVEVVAGDLDKLLGDLEWKPEGVVQFEGHRTVEAPARRELVEFAVEQRRAGLEGLAELRFLAFDRGEHGVGIGPQFRVGVAHHLDAARHEPGENRPIDAGEVGETDRTPNDPPKHISTVLVGGNHAVGHEEGHRAGVIGHQAQRHVGDLAVTDAVTRHPLGLADEVGQHVGAVERMAAAEQRQDALHAGTGVDIRRRKVREHAVGTAEVLHEHEVPDLDETVFGRGVGRAAVGAEVGSEVVEDLRTRATRAGFAHLPEVVGVEALDAGAGNADRIGPDVLGVVVGGVYRHPDAIAVDPQHRGHELPGHRNGLGLEVVAEAEVAEHLEKREVAGAATDGVEIVVLAAGPYALLHRHRPGRVERHRFLAEEIRHELHHPRVVEHRGRRVVRDQSRRRNDRVSLLREIVREGEAKIIGAHDAHSLSGLFAAPVGVTRAPC